MRLRLGRIPDGVRAIGDAKRHFPKSERRHTGTLRSCPGRVVSRTRLPGRNLRRHQRRPLRGSHGQTGWSVPLAPLVVSRCTDLGSAVRVVVRALGLHMRLGVAARLSRRDARGFVGAFGDRHEVALINGARSLAPRSQEQRRHDGATSDQPLLCHEPPLRFRRYLAVRGEAESSIRQDVPIMRSSAPRRNPSREYWRGRVPAAGPPRGRQVAAQTERLSPPAIPCRHSEQQGGGRARQSEKRPAPRAPAGRASEPA